MEGGSFLSPAEQQYYPELFSRYGSDKESSGRVAAQRAMSLFRLSPQLSDDVIQRINELCGAGRLGYYGRSQFYCALKMIAMVQNGLPLPNSVDFVMQAGIEVPLPEFGDEIAPSPRQPSDTDPNSQMEFVNPAFNIADTDFTLSDRSGSTLASVPPLQPTRPANSNTFNQPNSSPTNIVQAPSSPPVSPSRSSPAFTTLPVVSPARTSGSLERNQSLPASMALDVGEKDVPISRLEKQASAPPAPTLSKTEEGWASFEKTVDEVEERDTSWAMYTGAVSPSSSCSSISAPASSHHTSESPIDSRSGVADSQEGDGEEEEEEEEEEVEEEEEEEEKEGDNEEEDVWSINKEQREYYSNQFKMLQPDPNGLLPGGDAKGFFEKSKLATEELSKIWQLSDVNKDGTLSLEEFCTAMHLVVLRKHHIPLPDELPQCLIPKMPTLNGDGPVPTKQITPVPVPGSYAQPVTTTTIHPIQPHAHTGRSVTPPSSGSEMKNADDNWATFVDSPFPGPPSPSSQPPVSFDFASISPDPDAKIFQPIALHLSPDGKPVQPDTENSESRPRTFSDPVHQDELEQSSIVAPSPIKPRAMTITSSNSTDHTPAKIAPPPEWGKARPKFGSAAPPCPMGEGTIDKVAPHPRIPRNRSSELEENRSHTGATISMHTPGRLPLYRQGAVTAESGGGGSPRGPALPRPHPQNGAQAQLQSLKVEQLPTDQERNEGPRRASVPTGLAAPKGAAPTPHSSTKTKRKAPLPLESTTQDASRRQSREGTVDSRSAMAYAGSTLPRPRLSKSMNAASFSEGAAPPPHTQPLEGGVIAPPLPPRKHQRNHSRSSSLDLNLVFQDEKSSSGSVSSPRPVIPPRPTAQQVQQSKTLSMDISSAEHDFADFSKFEAMKVKSSSLKMDRRGVSLDHNSKMTEQTFPPIPPRPSASEEDLVEQEDGKLSPHNLTNKERHLSGDTDADKRREQFSKERKRHLSAPVHLGVAEIRTADRKSVQAKIRQEKEENTKLSRHNSEMQQELRALTDQRLALEISLERLRPFTSS